MISVGDIKQYFYCPKVIYFTHVLHVPKVRDTKLSFGKEKHEEISKKEKRRKGAIFYDRRLDEAEKELKVYMESERFGIKGVLDYLIKTGSEYIPVEYKYGFSDGGREYRNHRYQLVGYALLVEDSFDTIVRRGFIHYERDRKNVEVLITDNLRRHVLKAIEDIKRIMEDELEPKATKLRSRCTDCEYLTYCGGM
ncbi:MAG: CRISPR-associated protein Cas4 [Candidatus Syntropharchaeia archaeon]